MNQWFVRSGRGADAAIQLFCLPYAGGSAAVFRDWSVLAEKLDVDVHAVELPGHGRRIGENPEFDVEAVGAAMMQVIDRPYAVFGHSLGARLGFELCRHLRANGVPEPVRLLVSGTPGPRLDRIGLGDSLLPDDEFMARVGSMGGTPSELLANAELRQLFLPVIRADFAWGDAYRYVPEPLLSCPVSAFAGARDPEAPPEQMRAWAAETTGDFSLRIFDGDHFFLRSAQTEVLAALSSDLSGEPVGWGVATR